MKLKLFVWKDVLCDWTCGVVFALAKSEEQARQLILEDGEDWEQNVLKSSISGSPEVYDSPKGFHIWGGG